MPLWNASANESPEDMVLERIMYATPEGDGGIAVKREIMSFPVDGGLSTVFNPGDTSVITLNSNGMAIDPSNTFLSFVVKCRDASGGTATGLMPILPGGASCLIEQVDTEGYAGQSLESIQDYNLLQRILDDYTTTDEFKELQGSIEGMPPIHNQQDSDAGAASSAYFPLESKVSASSWNGDTSNNRLADTMPPVGKALAMRKYCASLYTGRRVSLPLRASGIWGKKQYIPLMAFGSLKIRIRWAQAAKVLMLIKPGGVDTSGSAAGQVFTGATTEAGTNAASVVSRPSPETPYANPGVNTTSTEPAAISITGASGTGYTITGVRMVCAMVQQAAALQSAVDAAVNAQGLPLSFSTFVRVRTNVPASTSAGTLTQTLPKNASNAKSLFSVFVNDPSATTYATDTGTTHEVKQDFKLAGNALAAITDKLGWRFQRGVRQWQYRIGTDVYPKFVVQDAQTGYCVALEAIPRMPWSDKPPSVPYARYSSEGEEKVCGVASTTAAAAMDSTIAAYVNFASPSNTLDWRNYPNKFIMGVNLQHTPGVPLSGISTVSGAQPSLEVSFSPPDLMTALNERCNSNCELVTFMEYQRLLVVQAGQNVLIKE